VNLTGGVMVCRRVRRREPLSDVLSYLVPYGQVSVFTTQVTEVADHEHFISFVLFEISFVFFTSSLVLFAILTVFFSIPSVVFSIPSVVFASSSVVFAISPMFSAIATLAFAESGWTTVQRKVGNWMGGLRTPFVLNSRLPSLSYDHLDLLVYQTI
jgi:hypothetical protein